MVIAIDGGGRGRGAWSWHLRDLLGRLASVSRCARTWHLLGRWRRRLARYGAAGRVAAGFRTTRLGDGSPDAIEGSEVRDRWLVVRWWSVAIVGVFGITIRRWVVAKTIAEI